MSTPPRLEELFGIGGKAALVTGGSRGIGLMIAEAFVDLGVRTYITSRKAEVCEEVAASLSDRGTCIALPGDLSTEDGCRDVAGRLADHEDSLHILVNNAGATWGAPLEDYPDDGFDKVMAVNVKGVFHLTRFLLPLLRAAASADDPARVINIGSVDGIAVPATENYAYAASKAAVHMLTRQLAARVVDDHITVNAIAPGPFRSKMMAFILDTDEGEEMVASGVPRGRIGHPDDMAGAAVYLSSRAGSYLTGAILPVSGGVASI